jgi:DNA-binding transcriptional LysR family regulator
MGVSSIDREHGAGDEAGAREKHGRVGDLGRLTDRSADLAISSAHGVDPGAMIARPFCGVRVIPVAHRDHPLAAHPGPVPAAALREHPQVVLRDSTRGEITQAPNVNVLENGVRWTVTDLTAKLELIEAGLGWGGLPEHVVAGPLRAGTLVALDVAEFAVSVIALSAVRRRDDPVGPVVHALWSRLAAPEPGDQVRDSSTR